MGMALPVGAVSPAEATAPIGEASPAARMTEGLLACAEVMDLSDLSLSVAEAVTLYTTLLLDTPALFHVAPRLSYSYVLTEGVPTVREVYPVYTLTGEALAAARLFYGEAVAELLAELESAFGDRTPAEAEVVLFLHDLLAARYAYDTRPTGANTTAYALLREGRGVCQAYALLFVALCRGAGLEAHTVTSAAMDHAWNRVLVEGQWYHVDVTRDDPLVGGTDGGLVCHHRLLRSDGGMAALGYHGYTESPPCTSTRYETPHGGAALGEFTSPLVPCGAGWLGVDGEGLPRFVTVDGESLRVGTPGDADGDGALTPGDLLAAREAGMPSASLAPLRGLLVGDSPEDEAPADSAPEA